MRDVEARRCAVCGRLVFRWTRRQVGYSRRRDLVVNDDPTWRHDDGTVECDPSRDCDDA